MLKSAIAQRATPLLKRGALLQRALLSSETFYDSQSGLHIPVHNEKEISVFLNLSNVPTSPDSFVPAQFYKDDSSSDMPEKLESLVKQGITGLWLPPAQFPRDLRNLETLSNIAPLGFCFFTAVPSTLDKPLEAVSVMNEFKMNPDSDTMEDTLLEHIRNGTNTTLRLGKDVCGNVDGMSVANQLATLIDTTGGANYLWLTPHENADEDDVIEVCEEIMYLDVAGPTMQSRIVMDSVKEEVIDESMLIGINKFVVQDESQIDVVSDVAKAQGKELILR